MTQDDDKKTQYNLTFKITTRTYFVLIYHTE